jgi:hypothetical protein
MNATHGWWRASFRQCIGLKPVPVIPRRQPSLEPLRSEAEALQSTLRLPPRQDARDVADDGIDVVYRIERALAQSCQLPPAPLDRALLLIGRRHGFEDQ